MEAYKKILVAVDQSEHSDRAVLTARDLAKLSGGRVWVFHVNEFEAVAVRGGVFNLEEPEEMRRLLKSELDVFAEQSIEAQPMVRRAPVGQAAKEIVDAAQDVSADVIVMGSHGRAKISALFLGSTAYKVLHLADRPVLIVR